MAVGDDSPEENEERLVGFRVWGLGFIEQVPVSAYVGSSKNLKELKDFRVWGFELGFKDFGVQGRVWVKGLGKGSGFRVSGFGSRISGFGARVSGFGSRVQRSQFRVTTVPRP